MRPTCLLLWLFAVVSSLAQSPSWKPESTWVFAVGILHFQSETLHGWPEEGRMDTVMLDALRERGVPPDHILFLKNEEATSPALRKKFSEFVKRPGPNDTLIFYYAGHGWRKTDGDDRPVYLIPYEKNGAWATADVLDTIVRGFKGSQVLLTADCCHSGGLAEEAARHSGRISFGTLTSARSSATSTGNWTFTQCLTDLYKGRPILDLDHDGSITFAEAAQYADLRMAFRENQRTTHAVTGSFPTNLVFASAVKPAVRTILEGCEAREGGKWYKANILSAGDGKYFVTWPGWDSSHDSWVTPTNLRPAGKKLFEKGAKVEIEWDGVWYAGKVVRTELGLLLVHYEDYTDEDNEWVPVDRLRLPK